MATDSPPQAQKTLASVHFKGVFRDYQQTVLNNANTHLADRKIHIVAAPGSGKTVLGLELIRGLNRPTIVLSPTVTIRQQWGDRFEELFLPDGEKLEDYVSFNLKDPRVITSVTYQALHAASQKTASAESTDIGGNEEETEQPSTKQAATSDAHIEHEDFQDFDLIKSMQQQGVEVICLDEAHHLRSEWYSALVKFIKALGNNITIIALTATPPYDSSTSEWQRYEALCGPIDEEIFVPELVLKKTLCPHQDYLYFSYPTMKEKEALKVYRTQAASCIDEILTAQLLERAFAALESYAANRDALFDAFLKNEDAFAALFRVADKLGITPPRDIEKLVQKRKRPRVSEERARWADLESGFQLILDSPKIFTEQIADELNSCLKKYGLMDRTQVRLATSSKLSRLLLSSMGKSEGITEIVVSETAQLGSSLRMLILTDFIKKDMTSLIGTDGTISTMGAVPIFEAVRRRSGTGSLIALLTGSLVIVPNESLEVILGIAAEKGVKLAHKALANVPYSELTFDGSNKDKVAIMTLAFQAGLINVMIGTKSLLGEGWDSPCINALILATFVGSFMLSNQMRGRAIRVDKNTPDKTANIWHLVTLEPVLGMDALPVAKLLYSDLEKGRDLEGDDWDTIVRRFDCFMGPAYKEKVIESGIERIDILTPPYDEAGVARINGEMTRIAADRGAMARSWYEAVPAGFYPQIERVSEVPATRLPAPFVFMNVLPSLFLIIVETVLSFGFWWLVGQARYGEVNSVIIVVGLIVLGLGAVLLIRAAVRAGRVLSPQRTLKSVADALLTTLREAGMVKSLGAKVQMEVLVNSQISMHLRNATVLDQNIFSQALTEMLSPIKIPKYLLIKRTLGRLNYWQSYSCPTVLSTNKDLAELLRRNLSSLGQFALVITYNIDGRQILWKCCSRSYVNVNEDIKNKLMATDEH